MLKVRLRLPVYVVIVLMLLIGSRQSATTMASDAAHRGLIFAIAHCMTSGADEKGADDDDDDDMTRRLAVLLNLTTARARIPVIQRLIVISERTLVPAGVDLEGLPLIGDFAASKAQWLVLASTATAVV